MAVAALGGGSGSSRAGQGRAQHTNAPGQPVIRSPVANHIGAIRGIDILHAADTSQAHACDGSHLTKKAYKKDTSAKGDA